MFVGGFYFFF